MSEQIGKGPFIDAYLSTVAGSGGGREHAERLWAALPIPKPSAPDDLQRDIAARCRHCDHLDAHIDGCRHEHCTCGQVRRPSARADLREQIAEMRAHESEVAEAMAEQFDLVTGLRAEVERLRTAPKDLRKQIAEAIHTPYHFGGKPVDTCVSACWQRAAAVMDVLRQEGLVK